MGGGRKPRVVAANSLANFDPDRPTADAPPEATPDPPAVAPPPTIRHERSSRATLDERRGRWLDEREAAEARRKRAEAAP